MSVELTNLEVALGPRSYHILIGEGLLSEAGAHVRRAAPAERATLITNTTVYALHGERLVESLRGNGYEVDAVELSDGEKYKSLAVATDLYDRLTSLGAQRWDPIVALGGGVIGDLAGFVAGTYMRGVPLVHVPTTLLAQVDSSIGGKTGVNLPAGKNLVGTFYQPRLVLSDIATLATLEKKHALAGVAEVLKYGFLEGKDLVGFLEANLSDVVALRAQEMRQIVARCAKIKARVVSQDERDEGARAILNLGHTVGHALEALQGYGTYEHGEAISIGMAAAAVIGMKAGLTEEASAVKVVRLLNRAGLPVRMPAVPVDAISAKIRLDKKARDRQMRFVLLRKIGEPVVTSVPEELVVSALGQVNHAVDRLL